MRDDTVVVVALNIYNNLLNTELNLNCIKIKLVPRSKHNLSRLYKSVS